MKSLLLIVTVSFLFVPILIAQEIDVSSAGFSGGNDSSTFSLEKAHVKVEGSTLRIGDQSINGVKSFSISPSSKILGVLKTGNSNQVEVFLYDSSGRELGEQVLEHFNPDDSTLDISVFDDGRFVTRDNVVNFSFFDTDGTLLYNISNSTGSAGGETVSEMTSDRNGRTTVVYNPKIMVGQQTGSRARIVKGENDLQTLYDSSDRVIKDLAVSEQGSYITLITEKAGTDDQVVIFDRFGNQLRQFTSAENLVGSVLMENARFITIYSESRAQVFRVRDQERIGSTSFRSASVYYATYFPDNQQILALSGELDGNNRFIDPELHAIHFGKREISRINLDVPLSTLGREKITIDQKGESQYSIHGLNRQLDVQTRF